MIYNKGEKRADGYTSEEFKSNYSEQYVNNLAQHIDSSEQHTTCNYSEQHAEYAEQYVNFSVQHALWLLYEISSTAASSYGVRTLEIPHQAHHGLMFSLPSDDLS